MKIQLPYIDLTRHFPAIAAMYDAKAAEYNAKVSIARDGGDKSMNYLKSGHRELYFDFIRALKGELAKSMLIFKDTASLLERNAMCDIKLHSNRKRASERTKKSQTTIYRLIERLISAGIILEKINHGTQRDYELVLNPEMVPISDYKNEAYDPLLFILKNGTDTAIAETLRSICTPCSSNLNFINNKVITKNIQEHKKESAPQICNNEHTSTFYRNTGDPKGSDDALLSQNVTKFNTSENAMQGINVFGVKISLQNDAKINTSENSDNSYAQKLKRVRDVKAERTRAYSIRLVEFVISVLFATKNIYKSEREKAYQVSEYYFERYESAVDCDRAFENYRERVRLVQNYLDRNKDFDFSNIYPAHYMDPENGYSGFIMTGNWLKKQLEYKSLQEKSRKLRTEEAIVNYAVKRMLTWKNASSFNYWRSYVINKAPNRVAEYEMLAKAQMK